MSKGVMNSAGKLKYVNGVIIDITKQKRIENALIEKDKDLEETTKNLREINTALDVLLRKREKDRQDLQQRMVSNLNELVFHQLDKLKKTSLEPTQREIIESIESNLKDVTGQFSLKLSSMHCGLTHTEIEVANFVKHGKTTKEIASLLNLSPKTIQNHRNKIREKLDLKKKRINLRSYLLSIQ
jgi:DNA-binding CsgD family transcriptional regulator